MSTASPFRSGVDRRTFLKISGLVAGSVGIANLVAACGSDGTSTSGANKLVLRMPFSADMQVPDPDIMYEGEGVQVMRSCYDGLILYKSGTSEFVPNLAKSWEMSADGLTYTFHLVPDVKFHDGTTADATAWIKSFARRAKVNQGPAYMVADIVKTEAPDPNTLVVTLKAPNNAFLHYAACPWQMYVTSPDAIEKNAKGDDLAQDWIKTHDAGTGPYVMKEFVPGSHYTLERFDGYWGQKPYFKTIQISVTPEISNQILQLDQGAFDLVSKGFAIPDVLKYKKNDKFNVQTVFASAVLVAWVNHSGGVFADKTLRQALTSALDRAKIVNAAFSGLTTVQANLWPEDIFPAGLAPLSTTVDIEPLKAKIASLSSKKIDLCWVTQY